MPQPVNSTSWKPRIAAALLLVGVVFAVYANSLHGPFVLDDLEQIESNPAIRSLPQLLDALPHDPRPLVTVTLAINYLLGGLNPVGYHLFNVAIHAAAAIALMLLLHRTLTLPRMRQLVPSEKGRIGWSLVIALTWAIHPLNTAAVSYITQRSEAMVALFLLLSLYAALRQWQATSRRAAALWAGVAIVAAVLGALSKQVIVVLPLLLVAYDVVFLEPGSAGNWLRRRAVVLVGLLVVSAAMVALSWGIVTQSAQATAGYGIRDLDVWTYASAQPGVVLHYLRLALWPDALVFDYYWTPPLWTGQIALGIVLPSVVIALLLGVTVWGLIKRQWWGFCGAAFFLILAPTSSFLPLADLAFEHRVYLSLAAVIAVVLAAVSKVIRRAAPTVWPKARTLLPLIIVIALASRTVMRNRDYQDGLRLWQSVLQHAPQNARAWTNRGLLLVQQKLFSEAESSYRRAIELRPELPQAHNNLGSLLADQDQYELAIEQYRIALENDPNYALAESNWGAALARLGLNDEAIDHYEQALRLDPDNIDANYNMAVRLLHQGQTEQAIERLRVVLNIWPDDPEANVNMGLALVRLERYQQAIFYYHRAVENDPTLTQAWVNLAQAYMNLDRMDDAIAAARKAYNLAREQGDTALAERLGKLLGAGNNAPGNGQ